MEGRAPPGSHTLGLGAMPGKRPLAKEVPSLRRDPSHPLFSILLPGGGGLSHCDAACVTAQGRGGLAPGSAAPFSSSATNW